MKLNNYRKPAKRKPTIYKRKRQNRKRHVLRDLIVLFTIIAAILIAIPAVIAVRSHTGYVEAFRYAVESFMSEEPLWQGTKTLSSSSVPVTDDTEHPASAPFEIHMLDVGQGLSILVEADGQYLLYDGGTRDYSSYVVAYLKSHGIYHLEYMCASHYDEDHIAGLVGVLNTVSVGTAITPDYEADTKIYQSFKSRLIENGAYEEHPYVGQEYYLGNATIQVMNTALGYEDENDNSVVLKITYGDFSVLMTGDAETEAENTMLLSGLDLNSDLYIVGHHGSSSSSSPLFVAAVSPAYSFISAGKGNPYGHPTSKTLTTLTIAGSQIYRTDELGEVTAFSDGAAVWFGNMNYHRP